METELNLSSDAILYSVAQIGADSVIGIPDTLSALTVADYPDFTKRAVDELSAAKGMEMDFDGNQSMNSAYEEIIRTMAKASSVTTFSVRKTDGSNEFYAVYFGDGKTVSVRRNDDLGAGIRVSDSISPDRLCAELYEDIGAIPDKNSPGIKECIISTSVLAKKDKTAIIDTGCDEATGELIYASLVRECATLKIRRITDSRETAFKFYVTGKAGIMESAVEYTGDDETFRYKPVGCDEFKEYIEAMMKGGK